MRGRVADVKGFADVKGNKHADVKGSIEIPEVSEEPWVCAAGPWGREWGGQCRSGYRWALRSN